MPNRHFNTSDYRYGFQGQELDNEIKGEGNSINYKYRMHDPRVGRFFATDPLSYKYPMLSEYQFSANTPIMAVELEGLESSNDPNPTQNQSQDPDIPTDFVIIPEDGIPLSEVTVTYKKPLPANYDTRDQDRIYWTSEVNQNDVNLTYEQWKVKYGKPGETYLAAKARNQEEWGSYWEAKYAQWDKEAREERLRQKLWIFTSYFWMAEDVLSVYQPVNAFAGITSRVTAKSYSFSGILSKNSDDVIAYRNFGPDEYAAFRADGNKFSLLDNGFGEKQFWLDDAGLEFWMNSSFSKAYTIKIRIPKSLTQYERMLDGHRALSFDKYTLPKLNNNFKIEWFEVRPGKGF